MKRKKGKTFSTVLASIVIVMAMNITGFAAVGWQQNDIGWWYSTNDEGTQWYSDGWYWIDGNNDGISEYYYFDNEGYMAENTITPDNYFVNEDGAWVLEGVVQTRKIGQEADPAQISADLAKWSGKFLAKDDQVITVTNVNENEVEFIFYGYGEEGWYMQTYTAQFTDSEKLDAICRVFSLAGNELTPDMYSMSLDGSTISVRSRSFKVGNYFKQ